MEKAVDPRIIHCCAWVHETKKVPVNKKTGLVVAGQPSLKVAVGREFCRNCGRVRD